MTKDQIQECIKVILEMKSRKIQRLITKEIAEAHTKGEQTSRLTRLFNLISEILL